MEMTMSFIFYVKTSDTFPLHNYDAQIWWSQTQVQESAIPLCTFGNQGHRYGENSLLLTIEM